MDNGPLCGRSDVGSFTLETYWVVANIVQPAWQMTGFEAVGVFENASQPPSGRSATRRMIPAQKSFR